VAEGFRLFTFKAEESGKSRIEHAESTPLTFSSGFSEADVEVKRLMDTPSAAPFGAS
jgi:hypothetical protein